MEFSGGAELVVTVDQVRKDGEPPVTVQIFGLGTTQGKSSPPCTAVPERLLESIGSSSSRTFIVFANKPAMVGHRQWPISLIVIGLSISNIPTTVDLLTRLARDGIAVSFIAYMEAYQPGFPF